MYWVALCPSLLYLTLFRRGARKDLFDTFAVGPFELFGKGLLYILSSLSLFALYDYFLKKNSPYGEIPYLVLLSTLGLSFFMSSDNLLTLFVSVELSSISIYILTALLRGDYNSKESAFKYLLMGSVGTALFGMGSVFTTVRREASFGALRRPKYSIFSVYSLLLVRLSP